MAGHANQAHGRMARAERYLMALIDLHRHLRAQLPWTFGAALAQEAQRYMNLAAASPARSSGWPVDDTLRISFLLPSLKHKIPVRAPLPAADRVKVAVGLRVIGLVCLAPG